MLQTKRSKMDRTDEGRSSAVPFLLAAVSVCDIQAFTENGFAKKNKKKTQKRRKENEEIEKAVT